MNASIGARPLPWAVLKAARLPLYAKFVRIYIIDPPLAGLVGIFAGYGVVAPDFHSVVKVSTLVLMGAILFYIVHALDDITGVKTGIDLQTAPRKAELGEPKLLASGVLSMEEAKAVVWILLIAVAVLAIPVLAFAPPLAILAIFLATVITGQYSYGARWSYRGLGELTVLTNFAACAIVPYIYLTGGTHPRILWLGLLLGMAIVFVTFCSNFLDYHEDRAVGRQSLMVLLGIPRTKLFFTLLMGFFWILNVSCWRRGILPAGAVAVIALLPLHLIALRHFWGDRPLPARVLCFRSNRFYAVMLAAALLSENLTQG